MTATQRILVTGAGGFVGSHIVRVLLASGHTVLALDRHFDNDIEPFWQDDSHGHYAIIHAGVEDLPDVNVDAVVHGAAITAAPEEAHHAPEANFRANMDAALDVLAWSARQRVRRVVMLSSGAVYRTTEPGLVDETRPTAPLGLYAVAKDAIEKLVETLKQLYGRDVVAARLSNIYGPRERPRPSRPHVSLVARMVQAALSQGRVTVYRDTPALDWTFAADIGHAIERLLAAPSLRHALYHVASEQQVTAAGIARAIASALPGITLEMRDGPDPDMRPVTRLGTLSSARLRGEIGFDQWTPFEEGMKAVIAWHTADVRP